MTQLFLLDTNIVTEPLKTNPNPNVLLRLNQHQYEIAISATVWHELWFGCRRLPLSRRRSTIEAYLNQTISSTMPILAFDSRAADWYATERARLTNLGLPPPFADGQIAAVAAVNNLNLVTANLADYQTYLGVITVNWFDG